MKTFIALYFRFKGRCLLKYFFAFFHVIPKIRVSGYFLKFLYFFLRSSDVKVNSPFPLIFRCMLTVRCQSGQAQTSKSTPFNFYKFLFLMPLWQNKTFIRQYPAIFQLWQDIPAKNYLSFPQQFLYFFPLPHGHGSFLPILFSFLTGSFATESSLFVNICLG